MDEYQNALNKVRKVYVASEHYDEEDINLIQELVDKETPKKAKEIEENDIVAGKILIFNCPKCNHNLFAKFIDLNRVAKYKSNYCECCGQAIKWGDEDEQR